jgi:fermentation-respiration switch protein FrsA (DUF1100 family)
MKICMILIALLTVSATMFSGCIEETPESPDNKKSHVEIATTFMTSLQQKNYAIAYNYFDNDMKNSLPLDQLQSIWEYFIATYGEFETIQETNQTIIDNYQVVYMNCTFENNYLLVFRIVFDTNRNITGFWQDNAILLVTYTPPDYVNSQNFTEINMTIGKSPWQLPATLTIPDGTGPFSCVVLVHGSGPNDRDETIGPNKPFKDLAGGLASKGIAVLRYDKRTKIYPEETATNINLTVIEEVVDDALGAIDSLLIQSYMPIKNIIVLGHSLGGMMVPKIASLDETIKGCILMAAPARPLEDLFLTQTIYLANLDGTIDESEQENIDLIEEHVEKIKTLNISENEKVLTIYKSYWQYLNDYNPVDLAKNLSIPLLFLQGKRDYQVTYEDDFLIWQQALANQSSTTFNTYETLNHLFISGEGAPNNTEYMNESHVHQEVINDIVNWIKAL